MKYKNLGRTGWKVSQISFGAWAIGAGWGDVSEEDAMEALHASVDNGINFFDTADVYGDGRSEKFLAKLKSDRDEQIIIATKAGRRLNPHNSAGYNKKNLEEFIDRSLKNLNTECLDLLQLHCPPTDVYYMPEVFQYLDDLIKKGKIKYYGVSVEKVEEALKAIEFPNVQTVQIIFNMFRQRPSDLFFSQALKKKVGILARVPLASGLLTGKFSKDSKFESDDHRNFNRHGEAFDRGETFSGIDYDIGLNAVDELKNICPDSFSLAQFALKWILSFDAVTCAIPGGKNKNQVEKNAAAADLPEIPDITLERVKDIYDRLIKKSVHHLW